MRMFHCCILRTAWSPTVASVKDCLCPYYAGSHPHRMTSQVSSAMGGLLWLGDCVLGHTLRTICARSYQAIAKRNSPEHRAETFLLKPNGGGQTVESFFMSLELLRTYMTDSQDKFLQEYQRQP
ncbi:hypothetical protein BDW69DRAFT_160707 [Aspergillus filifer]